MRRFSKLSKMTLNRFDSKFEFKPQSESNRCELLPFHQISQKWTDATSNPADVTLIKFSFIGNKNHVSIQYFTRNKYHCTYVSNDSYGEIKTKSFDTIYKCLRYSVFSTSVLS